MIRKPYQFCAGNSEDPKKVSEAITGLKRAVRYGKIAEKALKEIQEKGFYDGKAPVTNRNCVDDWISFPKVYVCKKEDFPGYGDFKLEFGDLYHDNFRGSPVTDLRLILVSSFVHSDNWKWTKGKLKIGRVRFRKSDAMTLIHDDDWENRSRSTNIHRDSQNLGPGSAYFNIAELLSRHIIRYSKLEYQQDVVPQKWSSLRESIRNWMLEDGHITRICAEILDNARIAETMKT